MKRRAGPRHDDGRVSPASLTRALAGDRRAPSSSRSRTPPARCRAKPGAWMVVTPSRSSGRSAAATSSTRRRGSRATRSRRRRRRRPGSSASRSPRGSASAAAASATVAFAVVEARRRVDRHRAARASARRRTSRWCTGSAPTATAAAPGRHGRRLARHASATTRSTRAAVAAARARLRAGAARPASPTSPAHRCSSTSCARIAFDVVLFGNGHVGRALVQVLAALPCRVTLDRRARDATFPPSVPANVEVVASDAPADEVADAPRGAFVVVMTHNHALDFAIVEAALARDDFAYFGLIGSKSKRAQFARRLARPRRRRGARARHLPDRRHRRPDEQGARRDRRRRRRRAARRARAAARGRAARERASDRTAAGRS